MVKNVNNILAFTLAEVLITLGIIGIVAAMTIPTILSNSQNMEYKVAYKKAYSEFAQAMSTAIFEKTLTARTAKADANATASEWAVIRSAFKVSKDCTIAELDICWASGEMTYSTRPNVDSSLSFIDASGRSWAEFAGNENLYLVDTNGLKGPNKYGKDRWLFTLFNNNNTRTSTGYPVKVGPYSGSDLLMGNDITSVNVSWCNYPPCYYRSWLLE